LHNASSEFLQTSHRIPLWYLQTFLSVGLTTFVLCPRATIIYMTCQRIVYRNLFTMTLSVDVSYRIKPSKIDIPVRVNTADFFCHRKCITESINCLWWKIKSSISISISWTLKSFLLECNVRKLFILSCTFYNKIEKNRNPYWYVDLGGFYTIRHIDIINRPMTSGEYFYQFILVSV
jgi:hypothetical protein